MCVRAPRIIAHRSSELPSFTRALDDDISRLILFQVFQVAIFLFLLFSERVSGQWKHDHPIRALHMKKRIGLFAV